jgi:uncharacterized membrane protein
LRALANYFIQNKRDASQYTAIRSQFGRYNLDILLGLEKAIFSESIPGNRKNQIEDLI